MGFWSIFRKKGSEPAAQAPVDEPRPTDAPHERERARERERERERDRASGPVGPDRDIAKICRVEEPGGPTVEEAIFLFTQLRGASDEARAVEELVRTSQTRRLPEPLLVVLGATLVDRGEPDAAAKILEGSSSSPALVLLADLAERRGDLTTALSYVERVLLRDLDHPGARGRHKRWRAQLGFDVDHKPVAPGATVVAREPDAPYDLLREVGRGGAGAVYEAIDRELGRHVALKVYHQPERDRTQLAHEARVAARLEGPGIVRVFDIDPDHGWVALEWTEHGALREHIRARDMNRLLPIERWAMSLAQALARVHAAGWVHHDVKPANVLLGRDGGAILTDFGIARQNGEPSPAGSLGYVSPERMAGRASEPRDDVYGFGRILEDVLDVVKDDAIVARYRPLAIACTGPDAQRPADGRALVTRLRVEIMGGS
jgi:hypothetical protein